MDEGELKPDEDYYFDENGLMVFTEAYLLKRGECCESGCRHCPYGFENAKKKIISPDDKGPDFT